MAHISLVLFHEKKTSTIAQMIEECQNLASSLHLSFASFSAHEIDNKTRLELFDKIHTMIPQKRGAIVTSRGDSLPLSGRKKLNLGNTPILLVEEEDRPVYVFPCRVGETYYSVKDGLAHLRSNLPNLPQLLGTSEKELSEAIMKKPELIERGLRIVQRDLDSGAGSVDIVFIDKNGRHLIVEVEREADDAPLGQILRLCAAYEKKYSIPRGNVRGLIACIRARESIQDGAKRAGIEIRLIDETNR